MFTYYLKLNVTLLKAALGTAIRKAHNETDFLNEEMKTLTKILSSLNEDKYVCILFATELYLLI